MSRIAFFLALVASTGIFLPYPASPGTITPHLISFQGRALDAGGNVVLAGDLVVRIYAEATGDSLVYDSGTDFQGAIADGRFSVLLGEGVPLNVDNTRLYHLEIDINGEEVVGDATGGRQAFYPGGGSHERTDLEQRLDALEGVVFFACDPGTFDLNLNPGDGCEFTLDPDGIYVSGSDPSASDAGPCGLGPTGTGAGNFPCLTITRGIDRAVETGRSTVYVADGNYLETITLVDGVSLRGGYRPDTWERHVPTTNTILQGNSATLHKTTVIAQSVSSPTTVEGFVIRGQNNSVNSGNSYAVYVADSPGLQLLDNQIYAGDGGDGAGGGAGSQGSPGLHGTAGTAATDTPHNCYSQCTGSGGGSAGGSGGSLFFGGTNISGGNGAAASCPDYDETRDLCTSSPVGAVQTVFDDGQAGSNGGGAGGTGGWDAVIDFATFGDCNCVIPPGTMAGSDGADGLDGAPGIQGAGATVPGGGVSGLDWTGTVGGSGGSGLPGAGGGGGGAGGGVEVFASASCSGFGASDVGGSGGGGGSGGEPGLGGAGGDAGGGSFAVFVLFTSPPASIPTISANVLHLGNGGRGGPGGPGGSGAAGGMGAAGGAGGSVTANFCAAAGGAGGDGGAGGHGGGGGGGAGGAAFGIYAWGQGGTDLSTWNGFNTFAPGGSGGSGGAGGGSLENPGTPGVAGSTGNTNF